MWVASLCGAATVMLHTAAAAACSVDAGADVPRCTPARFGVSEEAVIPPATPGLPLWAANATNFELVTSAGEPVPSELRLTDEGDTILAPLTPLAPDSAYRVEYLEPCVNPQKGSEPSGSPASWSFNTSASAPLPSQIGRVVVQTEVKTIPALDDCRGRSGELRVAAAQLSLEPAAELRPYLYVAKLSGRVPGTPVGFGPALDATGNEVALGALQARCDGGGGLTPDKHTVTITARIPGATVQPAEVEIEVDLRCEPAKPTDDTVSAQPDAGNESVPSDGGVPADSQASAEGAGSRLDAPPADTSMTMDGEHDDVRETDTSGGCAVRPAFRRFAVDGALWLLFGAVLLRRGRRARSARSSHDR